MSFEDIFERGDADRAQTREGRLFQRQGAGMEQSWSSTKAWDVGTMSTLPSKFLVLSLFLCVLYLQGISAMMEQINPSLKDSLRRDSDSVSICHELAEWIIHSKLKK